MKNLIENYRDFEFLPLVYLEGAAQIESVTTEEGDETLKLPEIKLQEGDTPNQAWQRIADVYDPRPQGPYFRMIKTYVDSVMPETENTEKNRWIAESMNDFDDLYRSAQTEFFAKGTVLQEQFKKQLDTIESDTNNRLAELKATIDKKKDVVAKSTEISPENSEETSEKLNQLEKPAIKKRFKEYVDSQNDYYLNESVQEAKIQNLSFHTRRKIMRQYRKSAGKFREGMERKVMARLDFHLSRKGTTKDTIQKYRDLVGLEYKHFAGLDGNKGFIDIKDFQIMRSYANHKFDLTVSVQKNSKKQDYMYLESMYFMNYEVWEDSVENAEIMMTNDCYNSGTEGLFIAKINEYRDNLGQKTISSFKDAKKSFHEIIKSKIEMGPTAVFDVLTDMRNTVNGDRVKLMTKVKPESLQLMVFREREFLLSRRLTPETEHDKLIVEFMSTGREGRSNILKNKRAELFKAIKNIKYHYPKYIKNNFRNIAKKPGNLRYQPDLSKSPTNDDKAARVHALLMLASEAEGIVNNFSTTEEFKSQNLQEQLKKVEQDKNAPLMGLKFQDALKSKTSPYISELSRGGFNGRDLGLKALKVLGVLVLVANVANSIQAADGGDIFETTASALGNIATNPGVYVGAAAFGGAHFVEMNPKHLDYPFASEHDKMDMEAHRKMKGITKDVGPENMKTFLKRGNAIDNNSPLSNEWLVMDKLNPRRIKKLVDKANKKPHPKYGPIISNKDIELSIPKDERQIVLAGLSNTAGNARTRFLFYQKFLYGTKPNIQQLRDVCTD
ncbi:hypothetical protein JW758_03840 [Candidatus Peregrinibacteria bacterium]|nr:hypothetical protein [Candidatus Peregrinibacteria bacterium]